ncbi:hypothetical protein B0H14DRAFT_2836697 [Mycena olivaceomarginata]|nr:hypothetical protein B0H14DRAFT_2836697 [Mycena olivaceomarginata]
MASAPSLISRLYKDLAELHDSPYPGLAVFIDDANVRKFCLVLTPPAGPWKNLSLHFEVSLPEDWPISPPKISCSSRLNHPNLFGSGSGGSSGWSYICCDLLKTKAEIYRGDGYTGGYSPALTLRGLFLQFLTFFSSTKIDQDYGGCVEIGDSIVVRYVREESASVPRPHLNGHGRHKCPTCGKRRVPAGDLGLQECAACASRRDEWTEEEMQVHWPTQDELRQEWEKDESPATVIRREMTEIGPLLEMVKSSGGSTLHRIENRNHRWRTTLDAISTFRCKHCPYGTDAVPHCVRVVAVAPVDVDQSTTPLLTPPVVCKLGLLNDDVLYDVALHLPSESLISFSAAYPRLHDIVQSMHVLLQRELRCFFLRTRLSESILGIGIALDFGSRTLSSDFDWLSQRAFVEFKVRESVEKRDFAFFLPLAFSRPHFMRAYHSIWRSLEDLDAEVQYAENQMSRNPRRRSAGPPQHQETVGVVYRMMNNIVVSLMKSCDTALGAPGTSSQTLLHASEKAVVAYCHLFHLLICLARTDPQILRGATTRLRRFIDRKDSRTKTHVPDLGELIILIMLVLCRPPVGGGPPIRWSSLAGPFLEEVITRNARWVLKDSPQLEVMEQGPSDYRLAETFFRSKTSLRLVMFQITFLSLFISAYGADISRLDNNYGFPEKELPARMVEEVKAIYKINTWPAFFTRVRFPQGVGFGKEKFSEMLRDAMKTSAARRYHRPSPFHRLSQLRVERQAAEEEWLSRQ